MHSQDADYKHTIWNKNGTYYRTNLEPYREGWTDIPALHLFWSYSYTLRKILREFRKR